ncbi:hypothetical protein ABPG72_009245 [Tetrahymena utriculariae]
MDNLFEYVKQQLLCEKEIIQNVYDLLQLLNSEFARELLDKQQGDFILTYYFSRQSRIKKFNKVSDELISFIYKYRNYNYMMQNQFDKIMQAITMSKALQNNEEQCYQITDILDIGTMFKLLELDWIKRHNMTKLLSQPQTAKKNEKLNMKEMNQISQNQNYLFTDKDSSLQLCSKNLNDLTNSKNKNVSLTNINKDQTKLQKDDFIIEIVPQNLVNTEEQKDSKQNNLDFSSEEIDKIILKNQQKCLEFFQSFKQTWNFNDLKQGYFDEIQEKCIFHHTLSEEQINILNKYEKSLTKCRNKIKANSKIQSRKLSSQNYQHQNDNDQQDDKQDSNQQIASEAQDNNSSNKKNASDQKIKKKRGGFRRKRNEVSLNKNQQDFQQNINDCNHQISSQNQKQKENSKDLKDQNEYNKIMCFEQVETIDSNEISQQSQPNSEKMNIEQSYTQNPNFNIQIQLEEQQQDILVEQFNKIKEEQIEQDQSNLPNHNADSSKISQLKVEENNFQLQSPLQSQFQDKINNFLAYSFINSPFPQQFNGKVEQFELEQLNNETVQQNNSQQEQQKNEKLIYVKNEYYNTRLDEEKAKQQLESNLFENIQLNFENGLTNLNNQINFDGQYQKQELQQNNVTQVDTNQNNSHQNYQISQEIFKFKEELINETPFLLNDVNIQNQIQNKDEKKEVYVEMQNNLLNDKEQYQHQDFLDEEEIQVLENLILRDKLNKSQSQINGEKDILQKNKCLEKNISDASNQAENASSVQDSPVKLRMIDIFELKSNNNYNNNNQNQNTFIQKQSEFLSQQEKSEKLKSPTKIQKISKEKRKKKIGKTFKELTLQEIEIIKKSSIKDASNLAKQLGMSYQTMRKIITKVKNINDQ